MRERGGFSVIQEVLVQVDVRGINVVQLHVVQVVFKFVQDLAK